MKKADRILLIITALLYGAYAGATLYWYDWKLLVIIGLALWANNLEQYKKR